MYADITKSPGPLPHAQPQFVAEGITLLAPLTRRGHGPGLIILQQDSENNLEILDGVPSALLKWAEEGYVVAEIQTRAFKRDPGDVLGDAMRALLSCNKLEPESKAGVVSYDPELWQLIAGAIDTWPTLVGAVIYANAADVGSLKKAQVPVLCHIAGATTSSAEEPAGVTTYSYAKAKSFRLATPFGEDFDYWAESLSHTRNLKFLKPLVGGPYFNLEHIWDEHTYYEFADRSVEHTMSTMVDQPYVNHIPTLTGGIGRESLTKFYRINFIFKNSEDAELELISRTIGIDRVVDEFIYKFTHDSVIDWLLPGVPPTFKKVEVPFTAVVNIRGDRLYHEHIGWDQGTVLVQLGLLPKYLPFPYPIQGSKEGASFEYRVPVTGIDTVRKMRDRNSVVSNDMFKYCVRQI
ncbi:Carboxymethylenebutenolidase [Purpureocillium takamizusanense]|uniref:Carboxymethylenebutenolidase n=1 Tax=Purpureocillium takamizusanense TaxID=2060973 RepID=A0A9Q8VB08_9HYPO|nr:Carboxymethylenebutenolidase [Purpureocillium takamizusanense]UNI18396.1 Carboxymethylenebutenolidase [Purpureocillium takamizusanense]